MLYAGGVGAIPATRLNPEGSSRFALPYGSVVAARQLVIERADNARLEGLGCHGDRTCAPCAAKAAGARNQMARLDGGLGAESMGTDEEAEAQAEAAGLAAGYLEVAIPRLQALAQKVEAIGGPSMFEGYISSSYYDQFVPILDEARSILEARPQGLDQETREALAQVADTVVSAFNRVQQQLDTDSWRFVIAVLTANGGDLAGLLARKRATISRILADAQNAVNLDVVAPIKKKIDDALNAGRSALGVAGDVVKYALLAAGAALLLGLFARAKG